MHDDFIIFWGFSYITLNFVGVNVIFPNFLFFFSFFFWVWGKKCNDSLGSNLECSQTNKTSYSGTRIARENRNMEGSSIK